MPVDPRPLAAASRSYSVREMFGFDLLLCNVVAGPDIFGLAENHVCAGVSSSVTDKERERERGAFWKTFGDNASFALAPNVLLDLSCATLYTSILALLYLPYATNLIIGDENWVAYQ